jgi:predicted AlkP superfamily phosphohydrolase/phosphomutase
MGTPDMLGGYGTYQFFSEDTPAAGIEEGGGKRAQLKFQDDSARVTLVGPENSMLKSHEPVKLEFEVHRDRSSNAALLEVQGQKILLKPGQWSRWTKLDFALSTPALLPTTHVSGICRFYLQEVAPNFRLYVSPINIDPSAPAVQVSEPPEFIEDVAKQLGLFYTTGFQEDHKARTNGVFADDEFARQANLVLEERLALFEYAIDHYDDGLLFFYFSSSDLQSHIFWWNAEENEKHPTRSAAEAQQDYQRVKQLYRRLDAVIGDVNDRYGGSATILVMSDHGFANFGRQFNLNSWLRDFGFLNPRECSSILVDADWSRTRAYGLGINGLYLNLKGRERDGIVEPGEEQEKLTKQLMARLKAVRDYNGQKVIRNVYRADEIYQGDATELAPDLIVGYARGYRASWETVLGELTADVISDNPSAWSADHCADALEVPGVLCCNKSFKAESPSLIDIAPSVLQEFGVATPSTMAGKSIFGA